MALEIEHKFLLADDRWRKAVSRTEYFRQGYLTSAPSSSIRVRICGNQGWLNIKSATIGAQRLEYEYEIPVEDANDIADHLCKKPLIEKFRHYVVYGRHTWEIDEFTGVNEGLIVAEIELSESGEHFDRPSWLGEEVTMDARYYNNNLAIHPYSTWRNR
ncbi:MAG: CYTH domain-containing protein [Gammaproteobacteria bacterium]